MSWNKVFDFFINLKHEYERNHGPTDYEKNVIELWGRDTSMYDKSIIGFSDDDIAEILASLKITQMKSDILIHYNNYDKIIFPDFWDRHEKFFRECRSLVIDLVNEEIILAPFTKFFNINEIPENNIDNLNKEISRADRVEFTPKMDGSMQSARWYRNDLYMSGSQALDENSSWRLKTGKNMLTQQHMSMIMMYSDYTFIFEMISLDDAHVVKYKKSDEGMYLIGMRDVNTGRQMPYSLVHAIASAFNIKTVHGLNLTLETALENIKHIKASEEEGYVMAIHKDSKVHLVKIKGEEYVYLHKFINKIISPNLIVEIIAKNQYDDFISSVPDAYKEECDKVMTNILTYIKYMHDKVHEYYCQMPKTNKRDFMIAVNRLPRNFQSYVRNIWYDIENDYLIVGTNGYKKYREILEEMKS